LNRSHALEEVEVIESLAGKVSFRSRDGHFLPAKLIQGGRVISGESIARETPAGTRQEEGGLLRLVTREGLTVEERSLAIYEEVACASSPR
jgi:hypothetical protein